jgi:hypothetical protein
LIMAIGRACIDVPSEEDFDDFLRNPIIA